MGGHEISAVVFKQLYAIKELGPSRNPTALDQARGTLAAWSEHADPHVRETAGEALLCFGDVVQRLLNGTEVIMLRGRALDETRTKRSTDR